MVSTIDGKILSGGRNESVADLGSKADHAVMKKLERAADAVMLGAQTLRATPPSWNPKSPTRIVVSGSGRVPYDSCFLQAGNAYVATSGSTTFRTPQGVRLLRAGGARLDFDILMDRLRHGMAFSASSSSAAAS
jgi:riboflavin biosynthesis pyrimidine reductase